MSNSNSCSDSISRIEESPFVKDVDCEETDRTVECNIILTDGSSREWCGYPEEVGKWLEDYEQRILNKAQNLQEVKILEKAY